MRIDLGEHAIRSYETGDTAALVEQANNPDIARFLTSRFPSPYTEKDAVAWIEGVQAEDPQVNFAIVEGDTLIGGIGAIPQSDLHRRSIEIGYWLGQSYWGRGIATKAVVAFRDWVLDRFDLVRVYAGVFESNPASSRVLEKAGFTLEARLRKAIAKHGQILDELLYAFVRDDPVTERTGGAE